MADIFDEARPYGGQKVNIGDDAIRENNRTLKASLEVEHEPFDGSDEADGRHKFVTLQDMTGSEPTPALDEMAIYSKDSDGQPELFVREEDTGDIIQITEAGYGYGVLSLLSGSPEKARKALAHILLGKAIKLQGHDTVEAAYLDLIQLNASDEVIVGNVTSTKVEVLVAALTGLIARHAGGTARILTVDDEGSGNGLDADTVDTIEGAEVINDAAGNYVLKETADLTARTWSVAHGLGAMPRLVQCNLVCVSTEQGYQAEDRVIVGSSCYDTGWSGVAPWYDATHVGYAMGQAGLIVHHKTTGTGAPVATLTKWKIEFHMWK